jgi:hypothetical protein
MIAGIPIEYWRTLVVMLIFVGFVVAVGGFRNARMPISLLRDKIRGNQPIDIRDANKLSFGWTVVGVMGIVIMLVSAYALIQLFAPSVVGPLLTPTPTP